MTERNNRLAVVALALLVLSAFTYWRDVSRAERFERGQKFLSNLNPDEIGKISITKGTADDTESVTLERSGATFGERRVHPGREGRIPSKERGGKPIRALASRHGARARSR